jgi:hypothetical protein
MSCFGTLLPFDDFRKFVLRMRMCNANSINAGTVCRERFLIAQDEINGNNFAPSPILVYSLKRQ